MGMVCLGLDAKKNEKWRRANEDDVSACGAPTAAPTGVAHHPFKRVISINSFEGVIFVNYS
jgi:hypothetical protein